MPVCALIYGEQSSFGDTQKNFFLCLFLQDGMCPQFEIPEPLLIPAGFKTLIQFQGKNLEKYAVKYRHCYNRCS